MEQSVTALSLVPKLSSYAACFTTKVAWDLHNSLTLLTFIIASNFVLIKGGNLHSLDVT